MDQVREYYGQWSAVPQPKKIKWMKAAAFFCFSLFLLLLIIYAFGGTGSKSVAVIQTIVFTDGTPYNMQAIRYLAQRREVNVAMIVVANNSLATSSLKATYERVTAMVTALKLEGLTDEMAVYGVHGGSTDYTASLLTYLDSNTVKFLVLGPCTEAAWFLQTYSNVTGKVATVYVAGGAFNTAGNANFFGGGNTEAERNFYMDPTAAAYLMHRDHGRPVILFPLDVTLTWGTTAYQQIVSLSGVTANESARYVSEGLQWYYADVSSSKTTTVGIMAAAYLADLNVRDNAEFTSIPVAVQNSTSSSSVGKSYRPASGSDVSVILSVANDTYFTHLMNANLLQLA